MNSLQPAAVGRPPSQTRSFSDILKGPSPSFIPKPPCLFRGKPAISFSEDDIKKYSEPFHFTLIGKFSTGRPPMETLRKSFHSIGFLGTFTLGLIDFRHILIRFDRQEDYLRCWKRGCWSFDGFLMRVIKWHPNFSVDNESPLVPVWINLPLLPIHLYNKEALFSIGSLVGEPLKIDAATEALSRPSQARIFIELDLMKERCEEVHITLGSSSYWQKIVYENVPYYCTSCFKIGHQKQSCRKSLATATAAAAATPHIQEPPRPIARKEYRPVQKNLSDTGPSEAPKEDANTTIIAPLLTDAVPEAPNIPHGSSALVENPPHEIANPAPIIQSDELPNYEIPLPTIAVTSNQHDSATSSSSHEPAHHIEASASSQMNTSKLPADPIVDSLSGKSVKPSTAVLQSSTLADAIQDIQSIEANPINSSSGKQPEAGLNANIFELGELPSTDLHHSSDVDELDTLKKDLFLQALSDHSPLPTTQSLNVTSHTSQAPAIRGKIKKKNSELPSDRVSTRQSSRATSQSFP